MNHPFITVIPAQASPSSSPPCAGIQGHKETTGLPPRMPGQAGYDGERGNALFLILIAVALFAALSYAITQSGRGGSGIDREQTMISVADIDQFTTSLRTAVQRLTVLGCDQAELDFSTTAYARKDGTPILAPGYNDDAPPDGSCAVFGPAGGGYTYVIKNANPTATVGNTYKAGHGAYVKRDVLGQGQDGVDDLVFEFADVPEDLCIAYNDRHGIDNPGGNPPVENDVLIIGDDAPELIGQNEFCYYRTTSNPRHFIQVMLVAN